MVCVTENLYLTVGTLSNVQLSLALFEKLTLGSLHIVCYASNARMTAAKRNENALDHHFIVTF